MSRRNPKPGKCLEQKPTTQSVIFCGVFISITQIAFMTGLSISLISVIFAGKRKPTLRSAQLIAKGLDMDLEEFLKGLEDHVEPNRRYQAALTSQNN
jgi:transcriptional regulator with XRE-family HTH domain